MGSNIWRFDCRFVAATSGVLAGKTIAGPWTKLHLMLKLLYLIFAVLDVMDLAVFICCICRSFPAYVSAPKSGSVQC